MTDNEIIKALECCGKESDCEKCPYFKNKHHLCGESFNKDVLDLINRQKAEIERLKERDETAEKIIREQADKILRLEDENSRLNKKCENSVVAIIAAKAEAVKEFAERLKEDLPLYCRVVVEGNDMQGITDVGYNQEDVIEFIDEILKEGNIASES